MDRYWFYFGCGPNKLGHYLFDIDINKVYDFSLPSSLKYLSQMNWDGVLCPQPENDNLYKISLSRLGGWGYSAISWWDRSQDKRANSNSNILAPFLDIDPQEMLNKGKSLFPWVFDRLPQPLIIENNGLFVTKI